MTKWKMKIVFTGISSIFVLSGCGMFGNGNVNEVGDDLEAYYNDHIIPIQTDVDDAWWDFYDKTEDLSNEEFYDAYQSDLKPVLDGYYDELQSLTPEKEEVQHLHDMYLENNEVFWEAGEKEVEGHYQEDTELLQEADDLFDEYDRMEQEFYDELKRLMDEHGVEFEN